MTINLPILIFDLDGTLIDTAPDLVATLNCILKINGRNLLEIGQVRKMVGDGARVLLERGFAEAGEPTKNFDQLVADFIELYRQQCTALSKPYNGVVEGLKSLANSGFRMAVCTNKPQDLSEKILTEFELRNYFEVIVGGDRFSVRKPHGYHLLGALNLMNASDNTAIMIGDSYNDVASARNAKLPVILVSYGYTNIPVADLKGDLIVKRFKEIPAAVRQIINCNKFRIKPAK